MTPQKKTKIINYWAAILLIMGLAIIIMGKFMFGIVVIVLTLLAQYITKFRNS